MHPEFDLQDVRFTAAPPSLRSSGLLGWVSCRYGDLALDGLGVRRTLDGRVVLSFPARRDSSGRQHPYIRPIDDATRQSIEAEIITALGLDSDADRSQG